MRWQSTWPSKDIFHEFALDFAKKVNDMTGGELKIEVLPAGAVVPAFGLLDAVSQGHARRRPRRARLSLRQADGAGALGLGPGLRAWTPTCCWPGTNTAAARSCSQKLYASIGANVVSFPYGPMPTQPLGWFKKPVAKRRRPQGPEVPHRRHLDRRVHRAWAPRSTRCRAARSSRRWTAACSMRPSSTTPRRTGRSASPTCRRSACCRATTRTPSSSRSCSTRPSTTRCPSRSRRSSPTRSRRPRRTCSGRRSTAIRKDYVGAADQGRRQVLQDAGRDPAERSSRSTTRS